MTTTLEPFRATVHPDLIRNSASFFDNSMRSCLQELLQNSRRSGATRAELKRLPDRWTYTDNGPGCMPKELLGLGHSDWQGEVKARETPAGCGFFSLARRNPVVTCPAKGWRMVLTQDHFTGAEQIDPNTYTPSREDEGVGMQIVFDSSGKWGETNSLVDSVARYFPIDFFVDGKQMPSRQDFMAPPQGASFTHIQFGEGIRVLVALTDYYVPSRGVCYHGHEVHVNWETPTAFKTVGGRSAHPYVAVTAESESDLPVELPQRNKVIEGKVLDELRRQIHCTVLDLAAGALAETCVEPPHRWFQARDKKGYKGRILRTRYLGRRVVRTVLDESLGDYEIPFEEGEDSGIDDREHITFEEAKNGEFWRAPTKEFLHMLLQLPVPEKLDLERFFLAGMEFVRPTEHLAGYFKGDSEEENEWTRYVKEALNGVKEIASAEFEARWVDEKGENRMIEGELESEPDTKDNLYDSIRVRLAGDDDETILEYEVPVLVWFTGDKDYSNVEFAATRDWFEGMPENFPSTLAQAAYSYRGCRDRDDDGENVFVEMQEGLERAFAAFRNLEEYYVQLLIDRASSLEDRVSYGLGPEYAEAVIRIPLQSGHLPGPQCKLIRKFKPHYTFSGNYGTIACDIDGNRDPASEAYPEYHTFDVESMVKLGLETGPHDILVACGWHDHTRRIYVTPEWNRLFCTVRWEEDSIPHPEFTEADSLRALSQLLRDGAVTGELGAALRCDQPGLVQTISHGADLLFPDLPYRIWIFEEKPEIIADLSAN